MIRIIRLRCQSLRINQLVVQSLMVSFPVIMNQVRIDGFAEMSLAKKNHLVQHLCFYVDGIDEFAVMVGLAEEGVARLGAFYVPGSGRLYTGIADGGAWIASCQMDAEPGSPIAIGELIPLAVGEAGTGGVRLVRSRSHPDERLQAIEEALPSVTVIPSGSVGVKCARIAERVADLYVHPVPYLKEWDTCAPEAVLRGAGGLVTDCGGRPLRYGKADPRQPSGILAGDPASWESAFPMVRDICAPIL